MPRLKPRKQLRKGKRRHHESWKQRRWNLRNLVQSSGGACCYCGKPVVLSRGIDQTATIDHVVPRSRGGLDVVENMKLSCFKCNQHKGTGISFDVYLEEEQ